MVLSTAVLVLGNVAGAGPKIGVLLKSKSAFWSAAEAGAMKAGAEFGGEVIVKSPINEGDVGIQIQLLEGLLAQGVEAIVIAPGSKDTLIAPLAAAAAKGAKIVVFDTRLEGEQPYVFVGTDQRKSGQAAGDLLASLMAEGAPVGFLKHNQTSGATIQRELGAFERMRELRKDFALCGSMYVGTEKGAEKDRVASFFDQHPEAKAVLASSTPATLALIEVLKERKLGGTVKSVGFGFNLTPAVAAAIEQDVLQGWVAQLPGAMGFDAVKAAVALCKGEPVPKTITTEFFVVTKKNLQEPATQALLAQ
ncbi:MAG: substrate-binding domain-containing protein [Opitutaceae bacterium]|nr:substrate-binding domain-containing protein [Opitutaceae bacterium]